MKKHDFPSLRVLLPPCTATEMGLAVTVICTCNVIIMIEIIMIIKMINLIVEEKK